MSKALKKGVKRLLEEVAACTRAVPERGFSELKKAGQPVGAREHKHKG